MRRASLLAQLWRDNRRFIPQCCPASGNDVELSWRAFAWTSTSRASLVLATDWVHRSTVLVRAASQIIKRDGNLWHTVITSQLSAARAPLSGSGSLVADTETHSVNWYVKLFPIFPSQQLRNKLLSESVQCRGDSKIFCFFPPMTHCHQTWWKLVPCDSQFPLWEEKTFASIQTPY